MGKYVATISHLNILVNIDGRECHGLREKDLNHHDKMNFDAVLNIIRACDHLHKVKDSVATQAYINIMSSVINSYLDKSFTPLQRLQEIWFATFFLRYWRSILQHPRYTIKDNFITSNAFMCVEINALYSLSKIQILILPLYHGIMDHRHVKKCFAPFVA